MRYAVIMAGGAGQRLWPLSREHRPKQLLALMEGKSLLALAVERLEGLFEPENTYVITNAEYAGGIAEALPQIPADNIVGEPQGRDTANAIALAAAILAGKDETGTMAVFTADHVIRPVDQFARAVEAACRAAEANTDALLTFGIKPTFPHTGLGYIHCGQETGGVHEVIKFVEKPDHQTARRYVEGGSHYWNSGMFVWTISAIRTALAELLPDSVEKLAPVTEAVKQSEEFVPLLAEIYPQLQKISIDYAVMEKADRVLMVPLPCEWLDIGSWPAIAKVTDLDADGNAVVAENTVVLDATGNVIVSEDDHLLAVIGMDDCVIVHSLNATLVCNKSDSQRIKELLAMIESKYPGRYS